MKISLREEGAVMKKEKIEQTLRIIDQSNYFSPWRDVLLGDTARQYWQDISLSKKELHPCKEMGEYFFRHHIPFVVVTEYIDEFFRYHSNNVDEKYYIKNNIAEAFLNQKLKADTLKIQKDINEKLTGSLEKKRDLINAHLHWMQAFIHNIMGDKIFFELDPNCCTVGKWLKENTEYEEYEELNRMHINLHALTHSAMRMYEKKEYAYFLLLYLDISSYSYKIRDMIINLYIVEHISSIYIDPLTGISNYLELHKHLEVTDEDLSLFVFNIKEFSKLNLLYGHDRCNRVIKKIAEFLKNEEGVITAYRIYGDEFAVMIKTADRKRVAEKLKYKIEKHLFGSHEDEISLVIYGSIAEFNEKALELCEYGIKVSKEKYGLITEADKMDKNKLEDFAKKVTYQQRLRLDFLNNKILPHFQPIKNLKTNKITKYEAVMRIQDHNNKVLYPDEFMDTLSEMYIYPEVTKMMIQKTFAFFKELPYEFTLNLSYKDMTDNGTKIFIATILKNNPEIAKRCIFELLESEEIVNLNEIHDFLALIHGYGAKVALDDFGTGYANYDILFQLDIDYIKIDGSLIQSLSGDKKSQIFVESIVTIAKESGAEVIAEWVSEKETLDIVEKMGIDYAQGYYIGVPSDSLTIS